MKSMQKNVSLKNMRVGLKQGLGFFLFAFVVYTIIRFGIVVVQPPGMAPNDFQVFHRTAERFTLGHPIYQGDDSSPFKYSPTFLLAFYYTFFKFSINTSWALWCSLSMVLYGFALAWLCAPSLSLNKTSTRDTLAILTLAMICGWHGYLELFSYGQGDMILFSLFVLAVKWAEAGPRKPLLSAFCMSVVLLIKPQMGLLMFYFLIRRHWRIIGLTALLTLALLAFPALVWGWARQLHLFDQWQANLLKQQTDAFLTGNLTQSLAAVAARLSGHREWVKPLSIGLILAGMPLIWWTGSRRDLGRNSAPILSVRRLICFVFMGYTVLSPLSWRWITFVWMPVAFILAHEAWAVKNTLKLRILLMIFVLNGLLLQTFIAHALGVSEVDDLSFVGLYGLGNVLLFAGSYLSLSFSDINTQH